MIIDKVYCIYCVYLQSNRDPEELDYDRHHKENRARVKTGERKESWFAPSEEYFRDKLVSHPREINKNNDCAWYKEKKTYE